jgi:hypothetical protein
MAKRYPTFQVPVTKNKTVEINCLAFMLTNNGNTLITLDGVYPLFPNESIEMGMIPNGDCYYTKIPVQFGTTNDVDSVNPPKNLLNIIQLF